MNHSPVSQLDGLAAHPVAKQFYINVRQHDDNKLELVLTGRDTVSVFSWNSAGVCSCLMDYAARKAGFQILGRCFVKECEVSVHCQQLMQEFNLQVCIDSANHTDASYYCQMYTQVALEPILIAESQGTLFKDH